MKSSLKPLLAFIVCLWVVVVATYAKQVSREQQTPGGGSHSARAILMQANATCSSSSSGNPGQ